MSFEIPLSKFLSEVRSFYQSKDELRDSVKNWAKANGFFISSKSDQSKIIFYCIRGRNRDSINPTRTIKCNCPFKITGRKVADGQWKPSLTNPFHNHEPIEPLSVSSGRRLSEDQKNEVLQLHSSLVAPRQILAHINQPVVARDIYNIIASGKRKQLNGRTATHCLLDELQEMNCFSALSEDNGVITRLFFSFNSQIQMFRNFNNVVMADCTYKTNRYKMPLLHFIGLSNVGKSFSICFCSLKSEVKDDYVWALNAFVSCFGIRPKVFVTDQEDALINAAEEVFSSVPLLLCIWHLNKNFLKNCKPLFQTDEYEAFSACWNKLIYCQTPEQFETGYQHFKDSYAEFPRATSYIHNNLYPLKEKFVSAWTNQFQHFGSTSTSRAEGLHAQIKKYISSSREDLLGVCKAIKLAVDTQVNEIKTMTEQQKVTNYFRYDALFSRIKNKVSVHALDILLKQLSLDRPLKPCTGSFSQVYGMPCAHIIDEKLMAQEKLELGDICEQWRLFPLTENSINDEFSAQINRLQNLVNSGGTNVARSIANKLESIADNSVIEDPSICLSGRGRPVGSKNSTCRDPSGFEYVEGTTGLNRCGKCGLLGHNSRSCTSDTDLRLSQGAEGSSRRCGCCGLVGSGHNARTCPSRR
jgi:hypothetical protein